MREMGLVEIPAYPRLGNGLGVQYWILGYYFMLFYVILEPGHHGNGRLNRKLNWKGAYPVSGVELLSSCHPESSDTDVGEVLLLPCHVRTVVQRVLVFLTAWENYKTPGRRRLLQEHTIILLLSTCETGRISTFQGNLLRNIFIPKWNTDTGECM